MPLFSFWLFALLIEVLCYFYMGFADIDECKTDNHTCISEQNCVNTIGSHTCFCPKGLSGNGTKEEGCHKRDVVPKVVIGKQLRFIYCFHFNLALFILYVCC